MRALSRAARWTLCLPIRGYQRLVSPLIGQRCRFYPSCSAYAIEAIRRRGVVRGTLLAGWRLLRCNPFSPGGIDHVPGSEAKAPEGAPLIPEPTPLTPGAAPC